jgi:ATP-dependent helicase/nuclease subunit A
VTLATHEARDEAARKAIREEIDRNLFVEAGAGTGKTRALVDRYVALVKAGRPVEEIVAITFTEKAAAELQQRVRFELEEQRLNPESDTERLDTALASLDRAQISTIHAFCAAVLRSFAAEHGIDPSFTVQDEVAADRRFEGEWSAYLEKLADDPLGQDAVRRALELGLITRDLTRLARDLWSNSGIAARLDNAPIQAPPARWPDLDAAKRELEGLHADRVFEGDRLKSLVEDLLLAVQRLLEQPAAERHASLVSLAPLLGRNANIGRASNWTGRADIATARRVVGSVLASLSQTLVALRTEALGALLPFVVRFVMKDTRERCRSGRLVFDDLILQVRDVLLTSPQARRRLRARYRTMLIDEFQDTDPAQSEIALAFATDPDSGVVEQGRLFLVGDPKQSIYRFRRADMAAYSQTRDELRDAGTQEEQLALNQRSRREVLEFVNSVTGSLIGVDQPSWLQARYLPVYWRRDVALKGPGVAVVGGEQTESARDVRRSEAGQIAAYCRAVREEGWQVEDRWDRRIRDARFRDVAVLLPTRAILQSLERALQDAGVAYRVEGGSLVYATQEVRDIINCLSAIDDPADEVAVVAALRSPAYACSDVELARHKLDDRLGFDYMDGRLVEGTTRVQSALLDLRRYHERRGRQSLAALVEGFVGSHRLVEAGMYFSGSRDAFRRARFLVEQARAFEAEGPESLRAFVDWLERRAGEAILDYEGAALDDDEDAVRILTVHAAKGLEFPIVFLAGLGVSPSPQTDTFLSDRHSGDIAVSIGSEGSNRQFRLGDYETVQGVEREHMSAERNRLLYVATTRARDHLIVSLYHSSRAKDSPAQRLIDAGARDAATVLPELPAVSGFSSGPFAGLAHEPVQLTEEDFLAGRIELMNGARGRPVTSATGLGKLRRAAEVAADGEGSENEREDDTEPWARGRAGTHRGRAVHAALQVLPWDADDSALEALARAQAVAETIPDQGGEVAALLRRALATDAASRARSARRAMREVPFAFVQDGVTLEGFIDLVLEADDGSLEVVDWKTDHLREAEVAGRLERYRLQAGLYVLGLEAATGRQVRRVTYVFVAPGIEASPGEPETLASEALGEIRRFAAENRQSV